METGFIHINCSLCGSQESRQVYQYTCDAGEILGEMNVPLVMCDQCGFVYMNPRPAKELLTRHYHNNSSGATYHENTPGGIKGQLALDRVSFIEKHIRGIASGRMMDVGCGQGHLIKMINAPEWDKIGLDPAIRDDLTDAPGITIIKGYLEEHAAADERYDVVISISALEHFFNPDSALAKLSNMLDTDGLLFLEVPNSLSPVAQIAEYFAFEHLSHFTPHTISALLAKHELKIIELLAGDEPSYLRLVAKKMDSPVLDRTRDDRLELLTAINVYKNKKLENLAGIQNRIEPQIERALQTGYQIAIYGCGIHTQFLLENNKIEKNIESYIDGDPQKWGKQYRGRQIHEPSEIGQMNIGAILISSHDFEQEIYETIQIHNIHNIPVIRCYSE